MDWEQHGRRKFWTSIPALIRAHPKSFSGDCEAEDKPRLIGDRSDYGFVERVCRVPADLSKGFKRRFLTKEFISFRF